MLNVPIRSRSGNVVLAIVGAVYALAALVPVILLLREAWRTQALVDKALLLALSVAAAGGIWFITVGLANLRGDLHRWRHH